MPFWQSFWLVIEIFVPLAYLIVLFAAVSDLFRDRALGGFAKAVWVIALIVLPFGAAPDFAAIKARALAAA